MNITKFQIGKSGVTQGIIEALSLAFKNHKQVRISALKASGRNRDNIKEMGKKLCEGLGALTKSKYEYRIIGFTIILIKSGTRNVK